MHYDAKKLDLYIFKEYRTLKTLNSDIYDELYNQKKLLTNKDLVIADSAEPKSIADFKSFGAYIRPVSKYGDSIRDGIKWLQGRRNIFIDKRRCPETWKEFSGYEYETDRDGNFISAYPDMDNHAIDSCLTGDTVISTPDGDFRIDSLVKTDGRIYSYDLETGEKKVANYINCRLTRENAEIWEIELEDGRVVNCTYDHKILTSNRGYVMACKLSEGDDVVCV